MKDKQFDHIISNKLDSLKANPRQSDWDKLRAKIELDQQSDIQFDSSISEKVSQFNMGVAATPDWENFSQKLNQTVEFDATILQKLNQIPTTHVSKHWLILQDRLQKIRDLKQSILRIKVGESLLMISLLLCFINFSHYLFPTVNDDISELVLNTSEVDNTIDKLDRTINVESVVGSFPNDKVLENTSLVAQKSSSLGFSEDLAVENDSNHSGISADHTNQSARILQSVTVAAANIENRVNDIIQKREVVVASTTLVKRTESQSSISDPSLIPILTSTVESKKVSLKGMKLSTLHNVEVANEKIDKVKPHSGFAIHSLIGLGVDQISTPDDERFDLIGYQHYALNSDAGLRVSYDFNNWSIETGVSILHKGYKPKYLQDTIRVQNEAVVVSLETIELELISIPVTVKRSISLNDKLSIYGMAGLEYLKITSETYDIIEKNAELPEVGKELEVVSDLEYKVNSPIIKNESMNYTVGLGLMKSINPLVDVYSQTLYRGQISDNGIGINQDKFNSLTVQAGFKLRLAKKN